MHVYTLHVTLLHRITHVQGQSTMATVDTLHTIRFTNEGIQYTDQLFAYVCLCVPLCTHTNVQMKA